MKKVLNGCSGTQYEIIKIKKYIYEVQSEKFCKNMKEF